MLFEGDDSILSLFSPDGGSLDVTKLEFFTARWRALGHRPKLYHRTAGSVAECVGHHFLVEENGLVEGSGAPDLLRSLSSVAYCCNDLGVKSAVAGDKIGLARAVAPGLISRAYKLALAYPNIARRLFTIAGTMMGSHSRHVTYSRDDLEALGVNPDDFDVLPKEYKADDITGDEKIIEATTRWQDMYDRTESRIHAGLACNGSSESERAVLLRFAVDEGSWYDFLDAFDNVQCGSDQDAFRAAIVGLLTVGIN